MFYSYLSAVLVKYKVIHFVIDDGWTSVIEIREVQSGASERFRKWGGTNLYEQCKVVCLKF